MGYLLKEKGPHLIAFLTKDIMDDSVISTVSNARKLGEDQHCPQGTSCRSLQVVRGKNFILQRRWARFTICSIHEIECRRHEGRPRGFGGKNLKSRPFETGYFLHFGGQFLLEHSAKRNDISGEGCVTVVNKLTNTKLRHVSPPHIWEGPEELRRLPRQGGTH